MGLVGILVKGFILDRDESLNPLFFYIGDISCFIYSCLESIIPNIFLNYLYPELEG